MTSNRHKLRLDQLLHRQKPELSRSRIQSEIMAGRVLVDGSVCDKPGTMVSEKAEIKLLEPDNPYVSRGGLKLGKALQDLSIDVKNLVVLDVGASTGGFTDCLLQKGAQLVYALDVGYGQLDYSLRHNPSVVVMERFNIRNLKPDHLPVLPDLAVVDVSFISLTKVLPVLYRLEIPRVLALIKPQFEVGRADAGRGKGVIRDPALHARVLTSLVEAACEGGYCCQGITFSNYPGPKGNIEYFISYTIRKTGKHSCRENFEKAVLKIVEEAHIILAKDKK